MEYAASIVQVNLTCLPPSYFAERSRRRPQFITLLNYAKRSVLLRAVAFTATNCLIIESILFPLSDLRDFY